ncbi:MAG: hypothetical protein OXF97_09820 [Nitrospira sp.]|nr:hypothetical protein [Nitrospira sp.]
MNLLEILKSEYLSILFGGLAGIITSWLTQRVLNKRGVFSYFVNHNNVGMSTDDSIFGTVSVTWNNNPVRHLFLSTIELKNESLNDYENVVIRTYTNDTTLLSESTQIVDTPNIIEWTEKYRKQVHVELGQKPTQNQLAIYFEQREYLIPVFNRGQMIRISYLNSAKSESIPNIWLHATVKGVKIKFREPQNQILGISQPHAALVGVSIGFVGLIPLVLLISSPWAMTFLAMFYGFIAQIPGAYAIKVFRKLREAIGG